ncbi:hypothetical protein ACWT_3304 [Actinoplanes sp. SE50]|nr:hypothetical protein ACPL_3432 [Actinoplanes sp. SE50/110]ATO82719.1 hypothetical protein ACWT_3304 [Actinoplanes sp. SE50]SLM00126.1 hypothetical protein ACSP50_3358 [Actinoplanes sp. SE50/110]
MAAGVLLATAILQAVSPLFVGFDQGEANDPVLVPPGPFFGIWGVVIAGSVAHAVWGLADRRSAVDPYRSVQLPLSLVHVLVAAWLLAAEHAPWATLPIFAIMVAVLVACLRAVLASSEIPRATRWLLGGTVGIYAG